MMGKRLLAIALSIVLSVMLCPALALAKSDGALMAASDSEIQICYVTYDDGITDPTTEEYNYGTEATVADAPEAPEGLTFLYWFKDRGMDPVYPGEKFTVTGDTVFHAQWEEMDGLAIVEVPKAVDGLVYNGKKQVGVPEGPMYTVRKGSATDVGAYVAILTLREGAVWSDFTNERKYVEWGILPAKNTAKVVKANVSKQFKAKAVKKAAKMVALPKVTCDFGTAKWSVVAQDGKKVLSLDAKVGKVKVKKGAKKGEYTMKVQASVKATGNYGKASTKVVKVKVTVK